MNQRELFLKHVAQTSDMPFLGHDMNVQHASGSILTAAGGKTYIDLISGISVSNVGHCHPHVLRAIREQSEKFMHLMVYGEYNQKPQVDYATLLASVLPDTLNCVYFTTGGSEAVEGAMKLAKRVTGRSEIVSFRQSYHGSTQGALSIMGDESFRNSFRPLIPGNRMLTFNDPAQLEQITSATAAVFAEPVQGEAGVLGADQQWLAALRKKCDEQGALLIFDEIQTGFGRTGSLFAFETYKIVPDVLLLAKGMGGGLPVGAFVSSQQLMSHLTANPVLGHINTFGGNAVCVAAAHAALEVILKEKLSENAKRIEQIVREQLKHPVIKEIRMAGALGAVEFGSEEVNMEVIKACIANGVVSDWFLFCPTAMRIAPPLNIPDELLVQAIGKILASLDSLS